MRGDEQSPLFNFFCTVMAIYYYYYFAHYTLMTNCVSLSPAAQAGPASTPLWFAVLLYWAGLGGTPGSLEARARRCSDTILCSAPVQGVLIKRFCLTHLTCGVNTRKSLHLLDSGLCNLPLFIG